MDPDRAQWHIDSPHEAPEHRPAHAVNVLLALADISLEAGPTEVARGTHRLTNHHRAPELLPHRDDLLYQTEREITPGLLQRVAADGSEALVGREGPQAMRAGDCLVFDDRILHRGLANRSDAERWVAYFSCERAGQDSNAARALQVHLRVTIVCTYTHLHRHATEGGARRGHTL